VGVPVGQTNYKGVSGANWGADGSQKLADIGTLWPNPGTNGSADGLNNGDGILWRCDISAHLNPAKVTDGMSHTFLVGEDVPGKDTWCSWPYANNAYSTCAIPPNFTFSDPNWWPNTQSFRSSHPGGVNFAFGDGSVQFVRDTIALDTYRALATRAGGETVGEY
jgi:prepilin-type processing-associated H-X9-DG protein